MYLHGIVLLAGAVGVMSNLNATSSVAEETDSAVTIVNPSELYDPAPYGFSHAVVAQNVGSIAYIAGQGAHDQTGALAPGFADQVEQAYANLVTALDAVGAQPNQVTRITTYVVEYDPSMLDVMTRNIQAVFGDALPAQTLVPVPRLALDGMLFEVDAVAVLD